ncbi:MAG: hypothetical protein WEB06_10545 [Actinomycetota bacterium]
MKGQEVRRTLDALVGRLVLLAEKDPEQEVRGIALPVLDTVIGEAKRLLPDHPVVLRFADLVSPENIETGEPIRAVDLLLALEALAEALASRYGRSAYAPDE